MCMLSTKVEQGDALPPCFTFEGIFSAIWVVLLFRMGPKCRAKVLFSVPKLIEAVTCLMEKVCVLEKLSSGISYSALAVSSVLMT